MNSETVRPGCQFASDNTAGICPEALQAINEAAGGCAPPYGDDPWTQRAREAIRDWLGVDCQVFFTYGGTAANALVLAAICRPYHSVICSAAAHVETDECAAPEFFTGGSKVLAIESPEGKLQPAAVEAAATRRDDVHAPRPRALSITQSTEWGTLYSPDELRALCDAAHRCNLRVHMDGARLGNALAALDVSPGAITHKAGVDVLCLGGTKAGLPTGDAVVFFDEALAEEFDLRRKQAGQLASKMRFLSAPWPAMLEGGAYVAHARHANHCAAMLEAALVEIEGIEILFPRQVNAVFAKVPLPWISALRERGWTFYTFIGDDGVRLMCSWCTREEEVAAFVADVQHSRVR